MKRSARLARIVAPGIGLILLTTTAVVGGIGGPAAASFNNQKFLRNISYYSVNNGSTFCRYATPSSVPLSSGGTASQARNRFGRGHAVLSITGATGYADDGIYESIGTLNQFVGYVIRARGASFASNLWLDTNQANDGGGNGQFFAWNGDCLTSLDGDVSALGPPSTPFRSGLISKVNNLSDYSLTCNATYQVVTLAQLVDGYCAGIDGSTPAAIWIGITTGAGGTLTSTILGGHVRLG